MLLRWAEVMLKAVTMLAIVVRALIVVDSDCCGEHCEWAYTSKLPTELRR